jgi:hypothetical protein
MPSKSTHQQIPNQVPSENIDPEKHHDHLEQLSESTISKKVTDSPALPDMVWKFPDRQVPVSQMSDEQLLMAMRHSLSRANQYHAKVNFFIESVTIMEQHADKRGIPVKYGTIEDVRKLLGNLRAGKPYRVTKPSS